jgi:putative ABC transport system permease protein
MPERFWLSSMDSPIWTPLDLRTLGPADALDVIVRRAAGLTPAMLTEQLQRGVADYVSSLPAAERRRWVRVADVNGTQLGNSIAPGVLWLVAASVLLTLLIAVSNVAILMVAQWTTREQEIGIRASLGASRGRLLRLLLTESVLVAIAGGLLGLCTMFALLGLILSRGNGDSRFYDLSIHSGVLLESAAVTLLAGFFAGIAPALYETRRLQANPLRAVSSDRVRQRWRHALVIFEIAVTVALLVVTGVMIDGYRRTMITDIGFDTHPLLSVRVERNRGVRSAEMLDLLRAMPGVASVAAGTSVPLAASGQRQALALAAGGAPVMTADAARISGGFFETLQVPMRIGRGFTAADFADPAEGARVAIVNATLANRLWPTRDPLGASLWVGQDHRAYQIIGVVADYSDAPLGRPLARVYLPLPREIPDLRRLQFVVRATGSPVSLVQAARQRVREQGSGYVASSVYTFDQVIAVSGQEVLVVAFAMVPLIAIGILLTAAGVYSVLSFAIARRGRELAVRVAIGATRGDLARLVVLHSARLVVIGTCLGVGATFWLTRLLQGSGGVFDSPGWGAFAVPVLLVLGVGALATWAPLRRVLRISPAALLRVS